MKHHILFENFDRSPFWVEGQKYPFLVDKKEDTLFKFLQTCYYHYLLVPFMVVFMKKPASTYLDVNAMFGKTNIKGRFRIRKIRLGHNMEKTYLNELKKLEK